ncbi:MAG: sporulation transcriptional regulator SpoIIID [Anaeroplasma sp.]|nr:sporulation transcriptional regulator SpoIIID [Anaeroplasma sp.]
MNLQNDRAIKEGYLMLEEESTVRSVAKIVGFSKSTVHNDVTIRLKEIDYDLYIKVQDVLNYNKKIRHIRGGEATKRKYQSKKKKN